MVAAFDKMATCSVTRLLIGQNSKPCNFIQKLLVVILAVMLIVFDRCMFVIVTVNQSVLYHSAVNKAQPGE